MLLSSLNSGGCKVVFNSNNDDMGLVVIPKSRNSFVNFTINNFNASTYSSSNSCKGANDGVFGSFTSGVTIVCVVFIIIEAIITTSIAIVAF